MEFLNHLYSDYSKHSQWPLSLLKGTDYYKTGAYLLSRERIPKDHRTRKEARLVKLPITLERMNSILMQPLRKMSSSYIDPTKKEAGQQNILHGCTYKKGLAFLLCERDCGQMKD